MRPITSTPQQPRDDGVAEVAELAEKMKLGMLTTVAPDGQLFSRPMAALQVDDDGDLWFVSDEDARKVSQVYHDGRANVTFSSGSSWMSISGTAEIVRDPSRAREIWTNAATAWFPDGPGTPGMVLVRIRSTGGEYWDTESTRVGSLLSFLKGRITGERPQHDIDETVDLR